MRGNVRQFGMIIALAAIVILFQITTEGVLLKPLNVSNLVVQNAHILILAIGMVIVIVARHIDLSVGSVAAFVGAVGAILMTKHDVPWPLAVLICLVLGAVIGMWHGFWVAYVGIPAFIVTLSSMLLFRGLTLWCSRARPWAAARGLQGHRQRVPARGRPGHRLPQPDPAHRPARRGPARLPGGPQAGGRAALQRRRPAAAVLPRQDRGHRAGRDGAVATCCRTRAACRSSA